MTSDRVSEAAEPETEQIKAFLDKLQRTDPEILVWIRSLLTEREAAERATAAVDVERCAVPGCDELPEDHYHPAVLTEQMLSRAIADAFAEHVEIADPRWAHVIAGYILEKLPLARLSGESER